jgi:hypothetical protein
MKSILLLLISASYLDASVIYKITMNTTSLNTQSGNLDFQFNAGNSDAQAATATVSAFTSNGTVGSPAQLSGDVTPANAALPGTFTLGNTAQFNDLFQPFTFGTTLSFFVTLGGPAVDSPNGTSQSGSTFGFSLYNAAGDTPLLTTAADGTVVDISINPGARVSTSSQTGASISAVPEPGTLLIAGLSLLGLFASRRRA